VRIESLHLTAATWNGVKVTSLEAEYPPFETNPSILVAVVRQRLDPPDGGNLAGLVA
jgi:hypothetical protein